MNIVAEYAKRVLVMKEGQLVFDGTPKDLFTDQTVLASLQLGRPDMMNVFEHIASTSHVSFDNSAMTLDQVVASILEQS
jgi:energy-coupling factor transport system ATP-binding protein